jgi:hypothetical protein
VVKVTFVGGPCDGRTADIELYGGLGLKVPYDADKVARYWLQLDGRTLKFDRIIERDPQRSWRFF